jgi:flagellar protein FliO/FliZ
MRFTIVILAAAFCLNAGAESSLDQRSDDAILAAAEQLIAEGEAGTVAASVSESAAVQPAVSADAGDTTALKESEIPVFLTSKKTEKSDSQILWRLVASIGVIVVVAGGMMYAGKRWTRHKDKGGQKARIEIMHQLHLGPRRSVALIRISGETMLIGITDHNVNMLKSISLIDDELEHIANKDFNGFLEDDFSIEDVRNAIGSRV